MKGCGLNLAPSAVACFVYPESRITPFLVPSLPCGQETGRFFFGENKQSQGRRFQTLSTHPKAGLRMENELRSLLKVDSERGRAYHCWKLSRRRIFNAKNKSFRKQRDTRLFRDGGTHKYTGKKSRFQKGRHESSAVEDSLST